MQDALEEISDISSEKLNIKTLDLPFDNPSHIFSSLTQKFGSSMISSIVSQMSEKIQSKIHEKQIPTFSVQYVRCVLKKVAIIQSIKHCEELVDEEILDQEPPL